MSDEELKAEFEKLHEGQIRIIFLILVALTTILGVLLGVAGK